MDRAGHWRRAALAAVVAAGIAACAPTFRVHGYAPSESELSQIEVRRDTRETVEAAFGRPAAAGLMTDGAWYYVQSRYRHVGARAPEEIERQVLAITFDAQGRVENIRRFGLEEGRVVVLSERVTESSVRSLGLIRQLLGNLGRFDPAQFLNRG